MVVRDNNLLTLCVCVAVACHPYDIQQAEALVAEHFSFKLVLS